jgi:Peptidase_C39 like family
VALSSHLFSFDHTISNKMKTTSKVILSIATTVITVIAGSTTMLASQYDSQYHAQYNNQDTNQASQSVITKLNEALGTNLGVLRNDMFDDESDAFFTARALGLYEESLTSYESSYRRYNPASTTETIFGCRVFAVSASGKTVEGSNRKKLTEISFLLSNKGDTAAFINSPSTPNRSTPPRVYGAGYVTPINVTQNYQMEIQKDQRAIRDILEKILGSRAMSSATLGSGSINGTAELGERWIVNEKINIFVVANNDYAAVRILPSEVFNDSQLDRKNFVKTKEAIKTRIKTGPLPGDTYLELPMINQGGKGYCAVATFARVLKYYGMRGDMDVLAHAAQTDFARGTSKSNVQAAVYSQLSNAGAHLGACGITMGEIKSHIDRGIPVIWSMIVSQDLMHRIRSGTLERDAIANNFPTTSSINSNSINSNDIIDKGLNDWRQKLSVRRGNLFKLRELDKNGNGSHCAMIIGYNEKTQEVAISNTWGEKYAVNWLTIDEAKAATEDTGMTIEF